MTKEQARAIIAAHEIETDDESEEMQLDELTKVTTPALESMLREKYQRDRYALFFDVPDAVSLDARRRIDAVAVGIWRSVGRKVEAFELKVSRSDWLRELKQVDKADSVLKLCDHFWLVTGDPSVAKLEEIPACWGWMTATKHGLRIQRPAPRLPTDRDNMPWEFTLGLLRKLQDNLLASPDVAAKIAEELKQRDDYHKHALDRLEGRVSKDYQSLKKAVAEFEEASGVTIRSYNAGDIGEAVKALNDLRWKGGINAVPHLLRQHATQMRNLLDTVERAATQIESAQQRQEPPA